MQIWKTQQWPQDWKKSVFIPIPKKGNAKECSNYCTIALISHTVKECSKFSKSGFSNMWTMKLLMFKLFLEKAEEPEINLPTSAWSLIKQDNSRRTSISALLNAKKAKWLSEEALQIAVKRREVKSKGEKERYKHLNAEFQRIARRDKKAFFSDQCKEIEEKKQNEKD